MSSTFANKPADRHVAGVFRQTNALNPPMGFEVRPSHRVEVRVEGKRIVISARRFAAPSEFASARREVFSAKRESLERLAKR